MHELSKPLHYTVVGSGRWANNYRNTLLNFDDILGHDLTEYGSPRRLLSEIYALAKTRPNCVFVIATHPKFQTLILETLTGSECSVIIEKPLAYNSRSYKILSQFLENNPNNALCGFYNLLNQNHIKFRKYISENLPNISEIRIFDGGKGPFRKQLGAFFDWSPHTFASLQAIGADRENLKISRVKSTFGENFEIYTNLNNVKITAFLGNGFEKKERYSAITLKDGSEIKFDFTDRNKKRFREMDRLINFSKFYFYDNRFHICRLYDKLFSNDTFILENAHLVYSAYEKYLR